jgi:HEAT repeat protein
LPFLVVRLNDWVRQVREAARAMLPALLRPENADAIVAALPLLAALAGKRRDDHERTLALFSSFLRAPAGIPAARRGTDSSDPAVRRACYQLLFAAGDVAVAVDGALLGKALRDPSPLLRLDAFRAVARLRPVPLALLEAARADTFLPVRREAFRLLLELSPAHAEREIRAALLDRSAGLRWEAVHAHWQRTRQRAVSLYRIAVAAETGSRQVNAVLGLGEHGDRADAALVVPFLSSPRIGLRRAAVRALARLDGDNRSEQFMTALEDASPGVSREAQRALLRFAIPPAAASRLEALVADGATVAHLRRNALDVLAGAGKWRAIPALVRACGDADPAFAAIAHERVAGWLDRYNRSFAQPTAADVAALAAALVLPAARSELGRWTCRSLDAIASAFSSAARA